MSKIILVYILSDGKRREDTYEQHEKAAAVKARADLKSNGFAAWLEQR